MVHAILGRLHLLETLVGRFVLENLSGKLSQRLLVLAVGKLHG
jgi:hypothetical protein